METPFFGETTLCYHLNELTTTVKAPPQHLFMLSYEQMEVSKCLTISINKGIDQILTVMRSRGFDSTDLATKICNTDVPLAHLIKDMELVVSHSTEQGSRLGINIYDVGFRLFFSILPRRMAPKRLADRTWNCSVPHWPQFRSHLQCNLCTECHGAEDEANCSHTTDRCGPGFLELGGACFFYRRRPRKKLTWMAASDVCTRWGGKLASLNTQRKWQDALRILKTKVWYRFKAFVGLLPPSAFKSLW